MKTVTVSEGFVKIHRKILDTAFFRSPNAFQLAIYLILKANHEDKKFIWNLKETVIKRGELVTSLPELKKDLGLSVQELRTSLQVLVNSGFLTGKSTNKNRILTIVKYNQYQNRLNKKTGELTDKEQTRNRQGTGTITYKNEKNEKKLVLAPPTPPKGLRGLLPPTETSPRQSSYELIIDFFKDIKGFSEIPNWNKVNYPRHIKPAQKLLLLEPSILKLCRFLKRFNREMDLKGLTWNLDTAVRFYSDYVAKKIRADKKQERLDYIHADAKAKGYC